MDILNILYAVLLMGGMGAIFGVLLVIVGKKFAVEADPRVAKVRECLSGANCGACGFPGCDACADAIVSGKAAMDACPVGGPDAVAKIAAVMGAEAPKAEAAPAAPKASLEKPAAPKAHRVAVIDAQLCVGCTMCKRNCKFEAITGEVKQVHVIDAEKCKGCGLCASKCPKKAITIKNPDGSIWTPPAPKA